MSAVLTFDPSTILTFEDDHILVITDGTTKIMTAEYKYEQLLRFVNGALEEKDVTEYIQNGGKTEIKLELVGGELRATVAGCYPELGFYVYRFHTEMTTKMAPLNISALKSFREILHSKIYVGPAGKIIKVIDKIFS